MIIFKATKSKHKYITIAVLRKLIPMFDILKIILRFTEMKNL